MYIFFMLFTVIYSSFAMESSGPAVKKKNKEPLELSLGIQVMYIGHSADRENLEAKYRTKFPLNTIFLSAYWSSNANNKPVYVPLDAIKEVKEGGSISLSLNGKKRTVVCKQQKDGTIFSHMPFEQLRDLRVRGFADNPQCVAQGRDLLVEKGVIAVKDTGLYAHGDAASEHMKELLAQRAAKKNEN